MATRKLQKNSDPGPLVMRSLYLQLETDDELRMIAARHKVSKSQLIRGAVRAQLRRLKAPQGQGANADTIDLDVLRETLEDGALPAEMDL